MAFTKNYGLEIPANKWADFVELEAKFEPEIKAHFKGIWTQWADMGNPLTMAKGKRLSPPTPLDEIRQYAADNLARLPSPLKTLRKTAPYPVQQIEAIRTLQNKLVEEHGGMVSR